MANVSAPVSGIVKSFNCYNGQSVETYQPLIEITGNEIIDIQNDFAEASANYNRLKSEYERIKSLYNENVTSEKDFILAETGFKTAMAKYNGLKLKIEAIGFSVSKSENGVFYDSYSIKSPIGGRISNLKANIGSYIDTQTELLEIINPDMFQLKLSVFAKDIIHLKKGQSVRFKSINDPNAQYATINSMGVAIDNETKSVECYAVITNKVQTNAIANEFIEAEIVTDIDTVTALPTSAIIKNEDGYYILVQNKLEDGKYLFNKVEVKTGRQHKGYTEINQPKVDGMILTNGVYNISLQ
jgi:membrane fusion protein, heavy metal efflux system